MSNATQLRLSALLAAAAAAAAGLIVLAFVQPKSAAAGWLIGFLFWSQVPIGSVVLLLIHALTGGRWGESLQPALGPAAAAAPLLLLLIVPVFLAVPTLYPWAQGSGAVKPDVAAYYLNAPWFIARSLIALVGWSVLAILLPRLRGLAGQLLAGLGLAFHALIVSSIAIDWVLSLEPPFVSSSFGASFAIMQLLTALAWAAVLAPAPEGDPVIGDVGALLLTLALGITYIDFMAVLVIWYGDLPDRVFWLAERNHFPWSALALAAFVFTSALPIFALIAARIRNSRAGLRAVGASVLAGSILYTVYVTAPGFGMGELIGATLAVITIGLVLEAVTAGAARAILPGRSSAHGY